MKSFFLIITNVTSRKRFSSGEIKGDWADGDTVKRVKPSRSKRGVPPFPCAFTTVMMICYFYLN